MKKTLFPIPLLCAILWSASCGSTRLPPKDADHRAAAVMLRDAGTKTTPDEQRAVLYLRSAAEAGRLLAVNPANEGAREIYNKAAADLTVLLRSADHGKLWNRPLNLLADGQAYRLRFAAGNREDIWDPAYFTAFTPAGAVKEKIIHRPDHRDGIGGALVGVRKTDPPEPFSPRVGVAAPVTAVLEFKGREVVLSLLDPGRKSKIRMAGMNRPLEADFSAPLAYYPATPEAWDGLMGAIRVSHYMGQTGLYMLQPYDPDRIPLIFIHGLISTPQRWRNVINELEKDPQLRGRYQCWVFGYPTGNPPAYSALRLREELEKVRRIYPQARDHVLVSHSMGGLLAQMQVTTVTRQSWDAVGKEKAALFFSVVPKGSMVERAVTFQANPHIARTVFICTPHRGSEMALGRIGELGSRLITLPVDLAGTLGASLSSSIGTLTGNPHRMPNSVTGLSPTNPMLKVLDTVPIHGPHHTIAGDRAKGDTPDSSDGVVAYWSSHLASAQSERIVPGPHSSCDLPETLEELTRILRLHLKQNGSR